MTDGQDHLFLRDLRVDAIIGVYPQEREWRQPLRFDLDLYVDTRPAGRSDELADALDYSAVAERVQDIARDAQARLIEHLAQRVATALLAEFPLQAVTVTLTKPNAVPAAAATGVRIHRAAGD